MVNAETFPIVFALTVLFFLPFTSPPVDDVSSVTVVVDGAAGIRTPVLVPLGPVPVAQLPAGGRPADQTGRNTFFVMLDSCCRDHRLNPSEDRRGSVVSGHHGLNGVEECLGDEDILLRHDEDVLVTHLGL